LDPLPQGRWIPAPWIDVKDSIWGGRHSRRIEGDFGRFDSDHKDTKKFFLKCYGLAKVTFLDDLCPIKLVIFLTL